MKYRILALFIISLMIFETVAVSAAVAVPTSTPVLAGTTPALLKAATNPSQPVAQPTSQGLQQTSTTTQTQKTAALIRCTKNIKSITATGIDGKILNNPTAFGIVNGKLLANYNSGTSAQTIEISDATIIGGKSDNTCIINGHTIVFPENSIVTFKLSALTVYSSAFTYDGIRMENINQKLSRFNFDKDSVYYGPGIEIFCRNEQTTISDGLFKKIISPCTPVDPYAPLNKEYLDFKKTLDLTTQAGKDALRQKALEIYARDSVSKDYGLGKLLSLRAQAIAGMNEASNMNNQQLFAKKRGELIAMEIAIAKRKQKLLGDQDTSDLDQKISQESAKFGEVHDKYFSQNPFYQMVINTEGDFNIASDFISHYVPRISGLPKFDMNRKVTSAAYAQEEDTYNKLLYEKQLGLTGKEDSSIFTDLALKKSLELSQATDSKSKAQLNKQYNELIGLEQDALYSSAANGDISPRFMAATNNWETADSLTQKTQKEINNLAVRQGVQIVATAVAGRAGGLTAGLVQTASKSILSTGTAEVLGFAANAVVFHSTSNTIRYFSENYLIGNPVSFSDLGWTTSDFVQSAEMLLYFHAIGKVTNGAMAGALSQLSPSSALVLKTLVSIPAQTFGATFLDVIQASVFGDPNYKQDSKGYIYGKLQDNLLFISALGLPEIVGGTKAINLERRAALMRELKQYSDSLINSYRKLANTPYDQMTSSQFEEIATFQNGMIEAKRAEINKMVSERVIDRATANDALDALALQQEDVNVQKQLIQKRIELRDKYGINSASDGDVIAYDPALASQELDLISRQEQMLSNMQKSGLINTPEQVEIALNSLFALEYRRQAIANELKYDDPKQLPSSDPEAVKLVNDILGQQTSTAQRNTVQVALMGRAIESGRIPDELGWVEQDYNKYFSRAEQDPEIASAIQSAYDALKAGEDASASLQIIENRIAVEKAISDSAANLAQEPACT